MAAACVLQGPPAPEPDRRYLCTLDLGTRNDRTVACIAHAERDGDGTRVVVDRLQVWTPRRGNPVSLDDVRAWLIEFCRSYRCQVLYDPSQAYLMVEQLRRADVRCREFVVRSSTTAAGCTWRGKLRHSDEERGPGERSNTGSSEVGRVQRFPR